MRLRQHYSSNRQFTAAGIGKGAQLASLSNRSRPSAPAAIHDKFAIQVGPGRHRRLHIRRILVPDQLLQGLVHRCRPGCQ